jgi:hypothetical protein
MAPDSSIHGGDSKATGSGLGGVETGVIDGSSGGSPDRIGLDRVTKLVKTLDAKLLSRPYVQ